MRRRCARYRAVDAGEILLEGLEMLRYLERVVALRLDVQACIGCGMCTLVCPHGVFILEDRKASIADQDACIECGACAINCPVNAISVRTGAGCATGVLLGTLGKENDCCSRGDGSSDADTRPTKSGC